MAPRCTFDVVEASEPDVPSLSTIVPRSFHPVNPYIKKCFPDTPSLRAWWSRIFFDETKDPNCHVLTCIDPDTGTAIGILTLRLIGPDEKGSGFWSMYDVTPDHDENAYRPMIDGMSEHRERLMLGKAHLLIELFGVDDGYKGQRVGQKLLARACEIGDEAGQDIFVQANASARGFYCKQGYEVKAQVSMPGEMEYVEYMLVRPCKS